MQQRQKARIYKMRPHIPRIVNAILFVICQAEKRNDIVTQYDIVKTIFLADRAHLNKYGRPITYDNYVAMKFGPVPSSVYDMLKSNEYRITDKIQAVPWSKRKVPEISETSLSYEKPTAEPSEDILSPSDMDELGRALTVVKSLGFHQIKKLTHEDQAYIDAWNDEDDRLQYPMSYALFFEVPSDELAEQVSFLSEHV